MDIRVKRTLLSIERSFVELVLSQGFKSITVKQIAANAFINHKTFYDHFSNKLDLANHLSDKFLKRYSQAIKERLNANSKKELAKSSIRIQWLLSSIIDDNQMRKSMLALEKISELHFHQKVKDLVIKNLNAYQPSYDPLVSEIIAAISVTMIEHYIHTDDKFYMSKQNNTLQNLEKFIDSI